MDVIAARLVQAEQALTAVEQALAARNQGTGHQRRRCTRLEAQRERARAEVAALRARRDELAMANAANPHPRRIILRLDGALEMPTTSPGCTRRATTSWHGRTATRSPMACAARAA